MSQVPTQPLQAETQTFGLAGLVSVFFEIVVKARMARYGLPNMIVSVFWYRRQFQRRSKLSNAPCDADAVACAIRLTHWSQR